MVAVYRRPGRIQRPHQTQEILQRAPRIVKLSVHNVAGNDDEIGSYLLHQRTDVAVAVFLHAIGLIFFDFHRAEAFGIAALRGVDHLHIADLQNGKGFARTGGNSKIRVFFHNRNPFWIKNVF